MNTQEIFDKVATHLIQQGEPAMNSNGDCVYRNDLGQKCAVGCLIPDDKYESRFEELGIGSVLHFDESRQRDVDGLWDVLEEEGIAKDEHLQLLEDLQGTHDHWFDSMDEVKEKLGCVAEDHSLNPSVLEK